MLTFIIYTLSAIALGASLFYKRKDEKPPHSVLSDPKSQFVPFWFQKPHYQILEVLYQFDPLEVSRQQIIYHLGKSKHHAYERMLWLDGYVNRREERTLKGKRHFYTLTSKGKSALINFCHKF